jgi:hypothetical protein
VDSRTVVVPRIDGANRERRVTQERIEPFCPASAVRDEEDLVTMC